MEEKMKEYKSKFTKMIFETLLGLCASWFVYNLAGKLTHSFLFAVIGAAAVLAFFLIKVFYTDYVCKETGKENYIDASNLKGEDYEQLLEDLGAKNENKQVIKVETIKK